MTERSIFISALERDDPSERMAYLDSACASDPALRQRVEKLLRAHESAGGILDRRPVEKPMTEAYRPITEGPGSVVGPYKLRQQIGEGGFGVVYMAEQEQPVRRMVALKIIKPGMDTAQVIARFESERQALALMDHPNIARVLDAGTTGGNPKSEARNPKQIQSTKSKTPNEPEPGVSDIGASDLDIVWISIFELRISPRVLFLFSIAWSPRNRGGRTTAGGRQLTCRGVSATSTRTVRKRGRRRRTTSPPA